MIPFIERIFSNRWIQHLGFWVLSFYVIGNFFSISNELKIIDFIYAGFFHVPLLMLVYFNIRWLVPGFLQEGRYLLYIVFSAMVAGGAYLVHYLVFFTMIPLLPADFYMVSFTQASVLFAIFLIYIIVSTLLKLSKSWYLLQQIEKEKLSLELNALKLQINPHFLFNSLNSLYSLARKKDDKTPDVILELSSLMRYMIYDVSDEQVALAQEIDAINNYLKLQRLRVEEGTDITFECEIENKKQLIAPLLFFPLIENSFKHGLKDEIKKNYVHIKLISDLDHLVFTIGNNRNPSDDLEKGKYGGIGLENVERRLSLIYGQKSEITVDDAEHHFEVTIKLRWDD